MDQALTRWISLAARNAARNSVGQAITIAVSFGSLLEFGASESRPFLQRLQSAPDSAPPVSESAVFLDQLSPASVVEKGANELKPLGHGGCRQLGSDQVLSEIKCFGHSPFTG